MGKPDRKALFLAALVTVGCGLRNQSVLPVEPVGLESATTPEAIGAAAWGVLITREGINRAILDEMMDVRMSIPEGVVSFGYVEIAGVDGYDYLIKTSRGLVRVAIDQVMILGGNPIPVERSKVFGIRNDHPDLMPLAEMSGAGTIRIAGDVEEIFDSNSRMVRAIIEANRLGYRPLVVFNPRYLRPEEEIREMITQLLKYDVDIEILNEQNTPNFWPDGNLETAAEVVRMVVEVAKEVKPEAELVVGALTEPKKFAGWFNLLKSKIDVNQVKFAAHAYQTPEELEYMVKAVYEVTGRPVMVTEFGVRGKNKRAIVAMIDKLWELVDWGWAEKGILHELIDSEGFGFADQKLRLPKPEFFILPAAVSQH